MTNLTGKLLSVNDFHNQAEILLDDGVTAVVNVPHHVAVRLLGAAKRAAKARKTCTVKVFAAKARTISQHRMADPVMVQQATYCGVYDDVNIGWTATAESVAKALAALEGTAFAAIVTGRKNRPARIRIVQKDVTLRGFVAQRINVLRRRMPNERGIMPLAASSGISAASFTDQSNPIR